MDYFGKLAAKNSFGAMDNLTGGKKMNIINIICGVLLIVLIIILIVSLMNNNDNFDNEDDIHMFLITRPGCGFASRASELFKKNGMKLNGHKVIEINIKDAGNHIGKELASKVNGTPTLACTSTRKLSVGLKSFEEYAKELGLTNDTPNSDHGNNSNHSDGAKKNGHILLIGTKKCPFCTQAMALMDEVLGKDTYIFLDSDSPEAKPKLKEHQMNGVPLIINKKTKQAIKGFNSEEIKKLK